MEPRVFVMPEMPSDLVAVMDGEGAIYQRVLDQPDDISPEAWCLDGDWTNNRPVSWVQLLSRSGTLVEVVPPGQPG